MDKKKVFQTLLIALGIWFSSSLISAALALFISFDMEFDKLTLLVTLGKVSMMMISVPVLAGVMMIMYNLNFSSLAKTIILVMMGIGLCLLLLKYPYPNMKRDGWLIYEVFLLYFPASMVLSTLVWTRKYFS